MKFPKTSVGMILLFALLPARMASQPRILYGNPAKSLVAAGIDTADTGGLLALIDSAKQSLSEDASLFAAQRGIPGAAPKIVLRHERELRQRLPSRKYLVALWLLKDPRTSGLVGEYIDLLYARRDTVSPRERIFDAARIHLALKDYSRFGVIRSLFQDPEKVPGEWHIAVLFAYSAHAPLVNDIVEALVPYLKDRRTPYRLAAVDHLGKLPGHPKTRAVLLEVAEQDSVQEVRELARSHLSKK